MRDVGLLWPGSAHDAVTDDVAVLRALLGAEAAWVRAQATVGLVSSAVADAVQEAAGTLGGTQAVDVATELAAATVGGGNPVIGLVARLRAAVPAHAAAVHIGLTSQDVLDTALVTLLRDATALVVRDLDRVCVAAATLARTHRNDPTVGRTLGQAAVPTTLGARFAGWLAGVQVARDLLVHVADSLPLSYGGAAGELSGVAGLGDDPFALVDAWGEALGLPVPPGPWHTTRTPVVRIATAFAETCAALGRIAGDVLVGVRPEVAELREPCADGRGVSSSMPHKRNPVLSVLLRRSAIAAPPLAATVVTAAGLAHDERPDGAWHAEWPALQQLARHAVSSAALAAEMVEGLRVDVAAAEHNLRSSLPGADGVGAAPAVVDRVLALLAPKEER